MQYKTKKLLTLLIIHEIKRNILSLRFSILTIVLIVVFLISTYLSLKQYNQKVDNYNEQILSSKMITKSYEEYGQLAWYGTKVDIPPYPLSGLYKGTEAVIPSSIWISGFFEPRDVGEGIRDPIKYLFPPADWTYLFIFVVSLLAIALGYDSINGEKLSGTLKLLLSFKVSRTKLIIAKIIGGIFSIYIPITLSIIVSTLWTFVYSIDWDFDSLSGFILNILIIYIKISVIYLLTIFISIITREPSISLIVSLLLWVILSVVVPSVTPLISSKIYPALSFYQINQYQVQLIYNESNLYHSKISRIPRNIDYAEFEKIRWDAWIEMAKNLGEKRIKLDEIFKAHLNKQIELSINLSRISPFACFAFATSSFAGTSIGALNNLQKQVLNYIEQFKDFTDKEKRVNLQMKDVYQGQRYDISNMPQFKIENYPISERINEALPDILILILQCIILYVISLLAFIKLDIHKEEFLNI